MLMIGEPQISFISKKRWDDFLQRLFHYLEREFPDNVPNSREALAYKLLERAQSYGLRTEGDLAAFVDLGFRVAPDFEQTGRYAWASQVLLEETWPPDARMEYVEQAIWFDLTSGNTRLLSASGLHVI